MSIRHHLDIRDERNRVIYTKQILGNNEFADDEFYENLNINIVDFDEYYYSGENVFEVDYTTLFYEWWKYLSRMANRDYHYSEIDKILDCTDKDATLDYLIQYRNTYIGQFFNVFQDVYLRYSDIDGFNLKRLKPGLKMYLSIF